MLNAIPNWILYKLFLFNWIQEILETKSVGWLSYSCKTASLYNRTPPRQSSANKQVVKIINLSKHIKYWLDWLNRCHCFIYNWFCMWYSDGKHKFTNLMITYNANNQIDYTTLAKDDPLCLCVRTYVQIMTATCDMLHTDFRV